VLQPEGSALIIGQHWEQTSIKYWCDLLVNAPLQGLRTVARLEITRLTAGACLLRGEVDHLGALIGIPDNNVAS